ncbi:MULTISPECIES: ABC transporter permease [Cellvibrio]|uniref:ABC transport system permease protein n=1 Tax=Cellvibrio fibrivorans TaxID=126350 RepID=A0ABU1UZP5_9GAMM|nr:ABC transporter permease [Cellvibrio fibrivorans]MDR7090677.1 putative ABC transport system permease protein [Cellvibrio fibrivorans]
MYYLQFLLSNLGRKKARTILTVLSIMIAFLLFGLLRSLAAAFDQGAEIAGEDRLVSINKISLIQALPEAYLPKVQALEGVDRATSANWFGGYYQDPKNQFPQFPIVAEDYFEIYKEMITLPEAQMQAWKKNRIGVVIGKALVDRFKWKIGDRIPLMGMFPREGGSTTWEFVIEGIYEAKSKSADTSAMLMHYDYFDEARQYGKGDLGWLIIRVKDPKQAAQVAAAVDALFANSPAETKTSSEKDFAKSFAKQFGDIGLITTLILGAVFFTMLLVAGNTMAQSFRERIPELAILKTLGFSDQAVMIMVLAEAIVISLIGGLAGLFLAKFFISGAAESLAATLPGLNLSTTMMLFGVGLMFLFGLLTGIIPALQGLQLNIVAALRRR